MRLETRLSKGLLKWSITVSQNLRLLEYSVFSHFRVENEMYGGESLKWLLESSLFYLDTIQVKLQEGGEFL